MTHKTTISTVILWEDEVRQCAKLLRQFLEMPKGAKDDEGEASAALLNAMVAALNGAENDEATLLLGCKTEAILTAIENANNAAIRDRSKP